MAVLGVTRCCKIHLCQRVGGIWGPKMEAAYFSELVINNRFVTWHFLEDSSLSIHYSDDLKFHTPIIIPGMLADITYLSEGEWNWLGVSPGRPVSEALKAVRLAVVICQHTFIYTRILYMLFVYRVSQEECARLREGVPYVKVYRYNPKHQCPKLNGYGDNGQRSLKLWQLLHTYWLPNTY